MECIGIWGGWSEGAVDLASFKRSSKLTLLVGICSTMERLNNNAWSNENYTAPARKEKLIALRLHSREVCSFKHMRAHAHTHGRAGKHFYTHTDTQVHVEPWLWAEPGLRTECATVCVYVFVCAYVCEPAALLCCAVERRIGPGPHSSPASLGERQYSAFLCLPIRPGAFQNTHTHTHLDKQHTTRQHTFMLNHKYNVCWHVHLYPCVLTSTYRRSYITYTCICWHLKKNMK